MKYIKLGLVIMVSFFFLISMGYLIYLLLQIDKKDSASIIGGMFTVIGGVMAVSLTQYKLRQRDIENALRSKKIDMYHVFLTTVQKTMQGMNDHNKYSNKVSEKDILKSFADFQTNIILWSSPEVVQAYYEFKISSQQASVNTLIATDALYRAIRDDIGSSNKNLEINQLIKMYLSDPNELDTLIKK